MYQQNKKNSKIKEIKQDINGINDSESNYVYDYKKK